MTLLGACRYGEDLLESAGVPEAGLNAWLLLEYVSGCIRSHYLAYPEEELPKEAEEHYLEVLKRRSERAVQKNSFAIYYGCSGIYGASVSGK